MFTRVIQYVANAMVGYALTMIEIAIKNIMKNKLMFSNMYILNFI